MNRFLSLGLGVQSSAIYYKSSLGQLPRLDAAIFADLGREKQATYDYLDGLIRWSDEHDGIPIIVIKRKNLFRDLLNSVNSTGQRWSSIPAYTYSPGSKEEGMLRRQCTLEYKILQVDTAIREFLNMPTLKGQQVEVWKGISVDEWDRMTAPEQLWKIHVYPFTGYRVSRDENIQDRHFVSMTRAQIVKWYEDHGLAVPPKSSCVFCPYQSDAAWQDMKENDPEDFEYACLVDEAIRDSSAKGIVQQIFLHRSLKPLREVNFTSNTLWMAECSGECHT